MGENNLKTHVWSFNNSASLLYKAKLQELQFWSKFIMTEN